MTANVGTIDRLFRLALGIVLVALPFVSNMALFASTTATVIAVVVGVVMIATSAMRFCPMYRLFGIGTCKL